MKKNMKKMMAVTLCLGMIGSTAMVVGAEETSGYQVNEELAAGEGTTLSLYGPGVFTGVGEEGSLDLISGVEKPGYNELIERWNELYPNCEVVIDAIPWDSWQTNITTACMSGDVDIIVHGATMLDLTEDLAPYIEAEPGYLDQIYQTASRMSSDDMTKYKVSGVSITVSPMTVWLDKDKFDNYGVELPSFDWTYDDMLSLAEQMTGTDPVTGEQTYGIQFLSAGENNVCFNHVIWANSLGADIFQYGTNVSDTVVDYTCAESVQAFQMVADLAQYASPEAREGVGVTKSFDGTNNWAILINEGVTSDWANIVAAGLEDRYICMSLPVCTQGKYEGSVIPYAGDNNLAIYKDSPDKEWAWEFIKFMTTDEVAVQWIADTQNIPNNSKGMDYVTAFLGEQVVEAVGNAMSQVPENYNNATNYVFNNVSFGATTNNLITAVDNVINGYMTAEEAAQFMQDGVDEYLASAE